MYGQHDYFQQSMEQPSVYGFILPTLLVVVNRTEKMFFPLLSSPFAPRNLVSRDGFVWSSRPASTRTSSTLRLNLVLTHGIPPAFRDGVHFHTVKYHRVGPEFIE